MQKKKQEELQRQLEAEKRDKERFVEHRMRVLAIDADKEAKEAASAFEEEKVAARAVTAPVLSTPAVSAPAASEYSFSNFISTLQSQQRAFKEKVKGVLPFLASNPTDTDGTANINKDQHVDAPVPDDLAEAKKRFGVPNSNLIQSRSFEEVPVSKPRSNLQSRVRTWGAK